MRPTAFTEQNTVLGEGGENETPVHVDALSGVVTACYAATPEERAALEKSLKQERVRMARDARNPNRKLKVVR